MTPQEKIEFKNDIVGGIIFILKIFYYLFIFLPLAILVISCYLVGLFVLFFYWIFNKKDVNSTFKTFEDKIESICGCLFTLKSDKSGETE